MTSVERDEVSDLMSSGLVGVESTTTGFRTNDKEVMMEGVAAGVAAGKWTVMVAHDDRETAVVGFVAAALILYIVMPAVCGIGALPVCPFRRLTTQAAGVRLVFVFRLSSRGAAGSSSMPRRRISDSKPQFPLREPDGWRKSVRHNHHHALEYACLLCRRHPCREGGWARIL